jgi:hypothetical protein
MTIIQHTIQLIHKFIHEQTSMIKNLQEGSHKSKKNFNLRLKTQFEPKLFELKVSKVKKNSQISFLHTFLDASPPVYYTTLAKNIIRFIRNVSILNS